MGSSCFPHSTICTIWSRSPWIFKPQFLKPKCGTITSYVVLTDGTTRTRRKGTKKGYDLYLPLGHRMILLLGMSIQMSSDSPCQLLRQTHVKTEHEVGRTCSHGAREVQGEDERSSLGNVVLDSWERMSETPEHRWKGCGQRCWRWEELCELGPEERGWESQYQAHTWPTGWTLTPSSQWENRADVTPRTSPVPIRLYLSLLSHTSELPPLLAWKP